MVPDSQVVVQNQHTELTGLIGVKTKYNEDVMVGTHTAVWGSFFCTELKQWGFKCCRSTNKNQTKCASAAASKPALLKKAPATE